MKLTFWNSQNILSLIVWKLQKKKEDVRCWLSNPALCHEQHDKKQHQNDGETSTLLVLSYYYLAPVTKVLSQAHHGICCYVYIFAILTYLTTVNQCLTIFFSKSYVIGKIYIRWNEKKHQIIEKVGLSKMSTVNPLF